MEEQLKTPKNIPASIESILFSAGYPVKYEKIAEVLFLKVSEVKKTIAEMSEKYLDDDRGIMLLTFPDSAQLCTKEEYSPYIKEALGIKKGGNLSASSMEVLAVVAYNQPVTRTYIDLVRGVDSNYAVNSLVDKGLIEVTGRLDVPGRPMLYSTTEKFLRVFGLNSLSDLPVVDIPRATDEQMAIISAKEENAE